MRTIYKLYVLIVLVICTFVPASVSAADNGLAGSMFTDPSYVFRFETNDHGNVVENYTLQFTKQEGDRLVFTYRNLKTGVDGEAVFTRNLDLCVLGSMQYKPCASYLVYPMVVGAKIGGNFTSTIAELERDGKVVGQEAIELPAPIGKVPAWRIEAYLYNKTSTAPGSSSPGIRLSEVIHYCAPPIGVVCSVVLRSMFRGNTVVAHRQLVEITRVTRPQASIGASPQGN